MWPFFFHLISFLCGLVQKQKLSHFSPRLIASFLTGLFYLSTCPHKTVNDTYFLKKIILSPT